LYYFQRNVKNKNTIFIQWPIHMFVISAATVLGVIHFSSAIM